MTKKKQNWGRSRSETLKRILNGSMELMGEKCGIFLAKPHLNPAEDLVMDYISDLAKVKMTRELLLRELGQKAMDRLDIMADAVAGKV